MVYDLIIIGAGPAGTAAAVYASRQRLNFLVLSKDVGGQLAKKAVDIENYPGFNKISGPDLVKVFDEQLKHNGVNIELDEVGKIENENGVFKLKTTLDKTYESKSVIIATGSDPRMLEVPGEKEFLGKGVSYCSLCDGPIFRDKIVAVVGGGNSGFETAIFLSNYVKKIFILEFGKEVKADRENQETVSRLKNIEIIKNAKILKIEGENLVNSLTYQDTAENKEKKLDISGVFIEVGYSPATSFVKGLVEFTERDEIKVSVEDFQTKTPGLFAAGDCNQGRYKQIITSAGEGAKASLAAYEFLRRAK